MVSSCLRLLLLIIAVCTTSVNAEENFDPLTLVTSAIDQTRGLSSYSEMTMLIKRPSWQRESTLYAWTRAVKMR